MPALLELRDLTVTYPRTGVRKDRTFRAVDAVNLTLPSGQTLGLVGESGSGKSTIGNAILGLIKPSGGQILYRGNDIAHATQRQRRLLAQQLQVIFQDPYSSLNPARTIGQTLADPLRSRGRTPNDYVEARVSELLERVGLSAEAATRYPAQFSGGQRQRIAIARALVLEPELVVCDEPTSSLDQSVQAQVLNLLQDLQEGLGLTYLFISHDIGVIQHVSHQVAVLLRGQLVEVGPVEQVTTYPAHPYTRALLTATPIADPRQQAVRRKARTTTLRDASTLSPPVTHGAGDGCPFVGRCPAAADICRHQRPTLRSSDNGAQVACHMYPIGATSTDAHVAGSPTGTGQDHIGLVKRIESPRTENS